MFEKLESFRATKQAYQNMLETQAERVIAEILSKFFEQNPKFASLSWTQYTPYFNDGEACVFSIGDIDYAVVPDTSTADGKADHEDEDNEDEDNYDEDEDEDSDRWSNCQLDPMSEKAFLELNRQFNESEDVLEAAFGDHAEIRAVRGQPVEVEDYSDHS